MNDSEWTPELQVLAKELLMMLYTELHIYPASLGLGIDRYGNKGVIIGLSEKAANLEGTK